MTSYSRENATMSHAHLHNEALSVTSLFPSKEALLIFPLPLQSEQMDAGEN